MDFIDIERNIELRADTDRWGPYDFDLSDVHPEGDLIETVEITALAGKVRPQYDHTLYEDITAEIIDPAYTPQIFDGEHVLLKFQFPPTSEYRGRVTLIFKITTFSAATYPLYFHQLRIR